MKYMKSLASQSNAYEMDFESFETAVNIQIDPKISVYSAPMSRALVWWPAPKAQLPLLVSFAYI